MFELTDGFADVVALSVFLEGGYEVGGFIEGSFGSHSGEVGEEGDVWRWFAFGRGG